ncbi:MAG TPA: glycerophosphodiester phosphodiesterase family protein [Polyangiales bacterium]|nr:glycerophosphodiester phosphodiesterase family protein [Polyangiales bacterium]
MSSRPTTWLLLLSLGCALGGCDELIKTTNPRFANGGLLRTAERAPQAALDQLQGIFDTVEGSDLIGSDAVTKTSANTFSIFYSTEAGYIVLEAGCLEQEDGMRLVLEGYWRYALTSRAGLVRLDVQPATLAAQLCKGETPTDKSKLQLTGLYGNEDHAPIIPLTLKYKKDLIPYIGKFLVAGHHGACPNYSDCGASINSIETMRLMPGVGADVAEVDVRVTKDGVPILYHDPFFGSSMTEGRYCNGKIVDLTWAGIQANCRLTYGEEVPTLDDALRAAVEETGLRGVWLDIKDSAAIPQSMKLVQKYNAYAKEKGRSFVAVVGLPTEDCTTAWLAQPEADRQATPCLLEYDPNIVKSTGCFVWGPTWTAGPRPTDVHNVQNQGLAAIFWTVNGVDYTQLFLEESLPNGFVSDRPSQAFYLYQMNGKVPMGGFQ